MYKVCIIIPARYDSSRFHGKPLAIINGKAMIHWVWEACCKAIDKEDVFIATDSSLIADYCRSKSIKFLMTHKNCMTGTDRIFEASETLTEYDYYVNVQGDEPLVNPLDILTVIDAAVKNDYSVTNAFSNMMTLEDYHSNAVPKVVIDKNDKLIYMSRAPIPANKNGKRINLATLKKQICIYVYKKEALRMFGLEEEKTPLEKLEDIEILRFLELGFEVNMIKTKFNTIAVDYPEDVVRVERQINSNLSDIM
jgi:3-deoxy-manno-octulosonate cytidylyltransferase (CMP-KDO synthetase)